MSDFQSIWADYQKIDFGSSGMVRNDRYLSGLGFFPGGRGLWEKGDENIAGKSIMVLGQDFGTLEYFLNLKGDTESDKQATWRNLLIVLKESAIHPTDCFFTNAFPGLREGLQKMVGKTPAWQKQDFIIASQFFFLKQFSIQKPQLILVLGENPARFLSSLSLGLSDWSKFPSIKSLDEKGVSVRKNIQFKEDSNLQTNLFLLTHPSYRHLNGLNRKIHFGNQIFEGPTAESNVIKQLII